MINVSVLAVLIKYGRNVMELRPIPLLDLAIDHDAVWIAVATVVVSPNVGRVSRQRQRRQNAYPIEHLA
jgi:hypothetical protein